MSGRLATHLYYHCDECGIIGCAGGSKVKICTFCGRPTRPINKEEIKRMEKRM